MKRRAGGFRRKSRPLTEALRTQMADIACFCLDVDGVLTDGRIHRHDDGGTSRAFHTQDGLAIRWFRRLGGVVILLTAKRSRAVADRAAELDIEHVIQGSENKLADLRQTLRALNLPLEQVAAVGDDLPDLPVLRQCGFPIAVANAVEEVKAVARLVTRRAGGNGAVREALEHVLRADGRWANVLAHYAQEQTA